MMITFQVPLEIIEEQLYEAEEDLIEQDPQVMAEIQKARKAYQDGDYQTIQEYVAARSGKTSSKPPGDSH